MEGADFLFFKLDKDGKPWTRDTFIAQNTRVPILVLDDECRTRFGEGVPTWGWQSFSEKETEPRRQKRLRQLEHRKRIEEAEAQVEKAQAKLAMLKRAEIQ